MASESKAPKKSKTIGEFFGVDLDGVAKACELGMNPAAAYMVLACFSDKTNRFTPASVKAVTEYTGISRKYAKQAIDALIDARLVGLVPRDSTRPNYEIFGAPQAPPPAQMRAYGYRAEKLGPMEQVAFDDIAAGLPPANKYARSAAMRAVTKGWLIKTDDGLAVREAPPPPPPPDRKMVWLPNALVKGISGATPPIQSVCETSDPLVLRMLVDLYRLQTLTSDGGIDRDILYLPFNSECLGTIHQYNVWAFVPDSDRQCSGELGKLYWPRKVWDCITPLENIKLIQWYGQLFAAPDGALLNPLGPLYPDKEKYRENDASWPEFQVGTAARGAGVALARHVPKKAPEGSWIIPVLSHIAKPTVVGIARLRYRPRVSDTAKWYGTLKGKQEGWLKDFGEAAQMALGMEKKAAKA